MMIEKLFDLLVYILIFKGYNDLSAQPSPTYTNFFMHYMYLPTIFFNNPPPNYIKMSLP